MIVLATEKSQGQTVVHIPILDVLKRTLDAGPIGDLAFIVTSEGKPFVKEGLGNAFKDACVAAGIPGNQPTDYARRRRRAPRTMARQHTS